MERRKRRIRKAGERKGWKRVIREREVERAMYGNKREIGK